MPDLDDSWEAWNAAVVDLDSLVLWCWRKNWLIQTGRHVISLIPVGDRDKQYRMYGESLINGAATNYFRHEASQFRIDTVYLSSHKLFVSKSYRQRQPKPLSPQQLRIASLLLADQTIHSIAKALSLSESTVQSHLAAMRERAGVKTTWGLVKWLLT